MAIPSLIPEYDNDEILRANGDYRALWASVILQAVRDIDGSSLVERRIALNYINDTRTGPGSFEWICAMLDLDTDRIRTMTLSREGRRRLVGGNQGNRKPRTTDHEELFNEP